MCRASDYNPRLSAEKRMRQMTHSKHECHEIAEDCTMPYHVYGGHGKNYIFAFHFSNPDELDAFLCKQEWTAEQKNQLHTEGLVSLGNEWARLEVAR